MIPLINYGLSHMHRAVLGGRTPLEVMTGRKPKSAVDIVLWCGKYLKDATNIKASLELVQRHCAELAKALDVMHAEITDATMVRLRKQCAKEAANKHKGAHAFAVGDLVMVAGKDNSANVIRKSKIMMKWQGPYQIVGQTSSTQFDVLLLGSPAGTEKPVHWTRMKRFGGSELGTVADLITSAQHDQQKFYIEDFKDWRGKGDGDVEILVQWRGLEATWEPIRQLHEDVPERVMKFLRENAYDNPVLQYLQADLRRKPQSVVVKLVDVEKAVEAAEAVGEAVEAVKAVTEAVGAVEGAVEAVEGAGQAVDALRVGEDVGVDEQLSNFTTMKLHGGSVLDDGYGPSYSVK